MTSDTFTFNLVVAERSIERYTRPLPGSGLLQMIGLSELFDRLLAEGAISRPKHVSAAAEHHRIGTLERVRIVVGDVRETPAIGVTSDHYSAVLPTDRLNPRQVLDTVEKLVDLANELLPALSALKLGKERTRDEIDYSDPKHLMALLEGRECEVLDPAAVATLVAEKPGPLLFSDIDQCAGGTWEQRGAPWANELERRLIELGAVSRTDEPADQ
jgi:hypothetical protein